MPITFIIHTDGAAKGNPGPAGIGVALFRDGETEPLATIAEKIAPTTNNVAEYLALLRGLNEALLRGADRIEARTDSELMARQIAGRYQVKSPELQPLFAEARRLLAKFETARVVHIPRGENALADQLANQGVQGGAPQKDATKPAAPNPPEPDFPHSHSRRIEDERWIWNVERLWELSKNLPVTEVPITAFAAEILDNDCWFVERTTPTVRRVAEHARRIYEADLSRPLILAADGTLMDGGHRVARAYLEKRETLPAVRFEITPEPDARLPIPERVKQRSSRRKPG